MKKIDERIQWNSKTINHDPKQLVAVIDKEKQLSTTPTIQFTACVVNQNAMPGKSKQEAAMNHNAVPKMHKLRLHL
jgi:hypothetical protein